MTEAEFRRALDESNAGLAKRIVAGIGKLITGGGAPPASGMTKEQLKAMLAEIDKEKTGAAPPPVPAKKDGFKLF